MNSVLWAALAIGGSTLIGAGCGFLLNHVSEKSSDAVTAFAAGVMLAAAAFGLFVPAMEQAQGASVLLILAGTGCGMLFLRAFGALVDRIGGGLLKRRPELMFVLAIALHKFPEGMAGGVGLNSMSSAAAMTVVAGIALQNLPEGAVMIPPLLSAGLRRSRAAGIALLTGLLNAAGVLTGALWGRLPGGAMPFALAFAGGAMLDVIIARMIPQTGCPARLRHGALITLGGFAVMTCLNAAF